MISLLVAVAAIIFFSFRAHEQEVIANQLESQLDSYKRNEVRLQAELTGVRLALKHVQEELAAKSDD